ncbi:MAG: hypothetical protein EBT07_17570 [Actinobacteria bacterium]|nr:hypothetical protein [Actinomycetota bacterium]
MNTNNTNLMLPSYTPGQIAFIQWIQDNRNKITVFDECTVSRKELLGLLQSDSQYIAVPAWIAAPKSRRSGRGNYLIPEINAEVKTLTVNGNNRGRKAGSKNKKGTAPVAAPAPAAVKA